FLRNRIRHELLPLLESMNPGIRATLLRNAEVVRVDVAWIEAQVNSCWPLVVLTQQEERIEVNSTALLTLPLSLQRHLLRRVTANLCAGQSPLELRHFELIEALLARQTAASEEVTLHLPAQLQVTRNFNRLVFERLLHKEAVHIFSAQDEELPLPIPGRVEVPGTPWIASAAL